VRLAHTAPDDCGNAAATNPLPPYRGFRHQVQPRNAELATAVEIFFRTGDYDAFRVFGHGRGTGDQVMLLAYLIANDFVGTARECEKAWGNGYGIGFTYAMGQLDAANGRELAQVLGWTKG
jgi:hypothetical protein